MQMNIIIRLHFLLSTESWLLSIKNILLNEASNGSLTRDDFEHIEDEILNALYNGIKTGFGQRDIESILSHEVEFGSNEYMKNRN